MRNRKRKPIMRNRERGTGNGERRTENGEWGMGKEEWGIMNRKLKWEIEKRILLLILLLLF